VEKLDINPWSKLVEGVEFSTEFGNKLRVRVKKEAILSAGAVQSPQILMLSGVGPAQHLQVENLLFSPPPLSSIIFPSINPNLT